MEHVQWGGSELLWSQTAERLVRSGHAVAVSVKQWPKEPEPICRLRSIGCQLSLRSAHTIPQRLKRRLYPDAAYSWLRRFSPDLTVISQCGNSDGLRWMETCARMRLPFAIVCQAAAEWAWPDDAVAERFRDVCSRAAGLYFVSKANLRLTSIQFATEFAGAKVIRNPFQVGYDANPPWPRSDVVSLACVARSSASVQGAGYSFPGACPE